MKLLSLFAVRIASTSFICSAISLSMLATSALAETFQVSGNKSLNTNNQFSYIDGHPRMAVWDSNNSDPDQNFDRLAGKWGVLFRNRSTKMCINAYYNRDGGAVSNWPCDANDPAQNFDLLGQGGNTVLLRKSNTNFCLNVPYHVNSGQVTAWTCNAGDADQRFLMSNVGGISGGSGVLYPPIPVPTPVPATKPTPSPVITTTTSYEFWLVAKQTSNARLTTWNGDVGHVTTAIVEVTNTFVNGVKAGYNYSKSQNAITTFSYWPEKDCPRSNCNNDKNMVIEVMNKGTISGTLNSGNKFAIRKQRITDSSVAVIKAKAYSATGCNEYGIGSSLYSCTCVDESTRLWNYVAVENFRPSLSISPNLGISPNVVYNKINDFNNYINSGGYANNGIYVIVK